MGAVTTSPGPCTLQGATAAWSSRSTPFGVSVPLHCHSKLCLLNQASPLSWVPMELDLEGLRAPAFCLWPQGWLSTPRACLRVWTQNGFKRSTGPGVLALNLRLSICNIESGSHRVSMKYSGALLVALPGRCTQASSCAQHRDSNTGGTMDLKESWFWCSKVGSGAAKLSSSHKVFSCDGFSLKF